MYIKKMVWKTQRLEIILRFLELTWDIIEEEKNT